MNQTLSPQRNNPETTLKQPTTLDSGWQKSMEMSLSNGAIDVVKNISETIHFKVSEESPLENNAKALLTGRVAEDSVIFY